MRTTYEKVATPARKFWIYVLGGLVVIIGVLLVAIFWKIFMQEIDMATKTVAPTQKVLATEKTNLQGDAPLNFITSYYQAIRDGHASQVQSAWELPNSHPARYAAQAVRESPVSDRCQPSQIELAASTNPSGAALSVVLQCHDSVDSQPYQAIFHLGVNKTGAWKIIALQDNSGDSLTHTGGVTVKHFIPDPVNTIYDFYDLLKKKHCQDAARMRPGYKGCDTIEKVSSVQVSPLQIDVDKAAVKVDVLFKKKDKPEERFNGYISLERMESGFWLIKNLASADKMSSDEFIIDFAGMKLNPVTSYFQEDSEPINIPLDQQMIKPEETPIDAVVIASSKSELESRSVVSQNKLLGQNPKIETIPLTGAGQPVNVTTFRSFGSEKILEACWTLEQLHGNPADKKIISLKDHPDYSPPLRQYPRYSLKPLPSHLRGSIRAVQIPDPDKKLVALTFDLCERASEITGYDAELVNYLRTQQVPATFYAGGKWMRSHPDQTKQLMADPLFEIGNHAWTHGNMRLLTGQEMKEQILWTQAQYELLRDNLAEDLRQRGIPPEEINRIPPVPLTFRYPYGTCSREALDFMGDYGLPSIQWNIVTADPWRRQTSDGIVKIILEGIKPGSIIIAHANGRGWKTSEALPKLIPALRARGYRFVTVTQLLAEGKAVEAADSCYELRVGDNQSYDKKVGKGTE